MTRSLRNAPSVSEGVAEVVRESMGVDLEIEIEADKADFDRHERRIGIIDPRQFASSESFTAEPFESPDDYLDFEPIPFSFNP